MLKEIKEVFLEATGKAPSQAMGYTCLPQYQTSKGLRNRRRGEKYCILIYYGEKLMYYMTKVAPEIENDAVR